MLNDYSEFIEWWLLEQELEYVPYEKYFLCRSIFTDDLNPSVAFYRTGWYHIFNTTVNMNGKEKKRLHIKNVMLTSGYFQEFVQWLLPFYGLKITELNRFRALKLSLYKETKEVKELNRLSKKIYIFLKEEFISVDNLISINYIKKGSIVSNVKKVKKRKTRKTMMQLIEPTDKELHKGMEYMGSRKLKVIDNVTYPSTVSLNNLYRMPCIVSEYPDKSYKLRMITEEHKLRFLSMGTNRSLFEAKVEGNDTLILLEGELNSNTISQLDLPIDVMGMNNCNTININNNIDGYTKIVVLVDIEEYGANKGKIESAFVERYFGELKVLPFLDKVDKRKKGYDANDMVMDIGFDGLKDYLVDYLKL